MSSSMYKTSHFFHLTLLRMRQPFAFQPALLTLKARALCLVKNLFLHSFILAFQSTIFICVKVFKQIWLHPLAFCRKLLIMILLQRISVARAWCQLSARGALPRRAPVALVRD